MSEPAAPAGKLNPEPIREARREPVFNMPAVVIAVIGACVLVLLVQTQILTPEQNNWFLRRTAFIPVLYSGVFALDAYAFSAPFTYTFLHGNWPHLLINMVWLAAFGSPLANRIGALRFALFFALTGLAAAALFWAIHPLSQAPLVGASGAISGMMGAAARFGFRIDRSSGKAAFGGAPMAIGAVFRSRSVVTFLAVWMIVNIVTGVIGFVPGNDAQIAWEAHIGGFLAGFFGLRLLDGHPRKA